MANPVSGFTDLHVHLLPGIDDGPPDLEGALEMARAAAESGAEAIAATPHLRADFPDVSVQELAERTENLREALAGVRIPLRIVSGAEASLPWALAASQEDLQLATYAQRGSDVLIETPGGATLLEPLLEPLLELGLRVTLAHPERSPTLHRHPEQLEALRGRGVLPQINVDALLAPRRNPVRAFAEHLCRTGVAQVLASDGHRATAWRPVTQLAAGVEAAAALVGPERARWMACEAPAAIIDGRPLPPEPEVMPQREPARRRLGLPFRRAGSS
jgi:protein-tyrosine phosphatase